MGYMGEGDKGSGCPAVLAGCGFLHVLGRATEEVARDV